MLEARSLAKLRALVAHAVAHVPYYRERFLEAEVRPEGLQTLDDLACLPVARKAEIRDSPPDRTTADNMPAARRWPSVTSGSTGLPFEFFTDAASADGVVASHLFFLDWAGAAVWHTRIDIGNRRDRPLGSVLPSPSRPVRWARQVLLGERVVTLSGMDPASREFLARSREASRRGAYVVRGYPGYLAALARELLEARIELPAAPRAVLSGGEELTALDADAIARAFRCRVVNHYAAWEVPHIAQTCPDNPDLFHVNSERVLLRVVGDDGRPMPPGGRGRILVTALENYVMPFINYEIGDAGIAGPRCPCGRGFPTLARIEGRTGAVIRTPAGRIVSPVTLDGLFGHSGDDIREYQAEHTAAGVIVLRVVPTARFGPESAARLRAALANAVGPGVDVRLDVVAAIPSEPSGKRVVIKPPGDRAAQTGAPRSPLR